MKVSSAALSLLALFSNVAPSVGAECTHGKLYVLDNSTSNVHIFDVSEGKLDGLTEEGTLVMPSRGAGELVYYGTSGDPLVIQYRGKEEQGYKDGFVRVVNTGFSYDSHDDHGHMEYASPSIYENANIDDCARPIHQVRHDKKIAIFCDGYFPQDNTTDQVNTTVHVVDETLLGSSQSAVAHTVVLEGTHHGVAVPVDDGHLLHSLALPGRIAGVEGASPLPSTFQVIDYEGKVLHELSDTSNPNTHCSGFHGSAPLSNNFLLACDEVHGGIVHVEYDPASGKYTSRAVTYPPDEQYEGFRMGSFAYHKKADHVVGSFSLRGGTEFHLGAITADSPTDLQESNILTLPGNERQCAYQFEVGSGELLLVFMPNGVLHVFEIENGAFTEIAQKTIVPNMKSCDEAAFVAGIGQAFVATPETKTLYAIDLHDVEEGELDVSESTLPFFPSGMTVSGFDYDHVCMMEHDDHAHDHDKDDKSGAKKMTSMFGMIAMMGALFVCW